MLNSPNFLQPPLFLRRAVEDTDCQPWLCFRVNRGLKILTLTLRESDLFDQDFKKLLNDSHVQTSLKTTGGRII